MLPVQAMDKKEPHKQDYILSMSVQAWPSRRFVSAKVTQSRKKTGKTDMCCTRVTYEI